MANLRGRLNHAEQQIARQAVDVDGDQASEAQQEAEYNARMTRFIPLAEKWQAWIEQNASAAEREAWAAYWGMLRAGQLPEWNSHELHTAAQLQRRTPWEIMEPFYAMDNGARVFAVDTEFFPDDFARATIEGDYKHRFYDLQAQRRALGLEWTAPRMPAEQELEAQYRDWLALWHSAIGNDYSVSERRPVARAPR